MRLKHVTLFLMIFLLFTGCASVNTKLIDPTGRAMPDPHYVLRAVGTPLTATFYYTAFKVVKDVDGTLVSTPVFLDFLTFHDIDSEKYKNVTLTIEVNNPDNIEFSLYQTLDMEIGKGRTKVQKGGEIKESNLSYRQFIYHLPLGEEIRTVDQHVTLSIENDVVMMIGNFRYNLIH